MRRSHRLALSATALLVACALGAAGARHGVAEARFAGGEGAGAAAARDALAHRSAGATGRVARVARDPKLARAAARAAHGAAQTPSRAFLEAFALPPIALDAPRALGVALSLGGRDPGAPRDLDLWRLDTSGRSARVARGRSAADGSLVFPPLVLPGRAVELVAAPAGLGPDVAGASPPVVVRRDPATPRVVATAHGADLLLEVEAAESGGAIVVEAAAVDAADPAGTAVTLARVDLAARSDLAPSPAEIVVPDGVGVGLRVVQIDPDGRRSPPRLVFVDEERIKQEQE